MDDTEKTLRKLGIKPVEGQNFLKTSHIAKALTKAGETENQHVLEIGPGTGKITEQLVKESETVTAVEKSHKLTQHLKQKFAEINNLELIQDDINQYEIPDNITRCVSNPPFQHATQIIERLGQKQIQSALILQEELADKIVADPGESMYKTFSIKAQYYFVPVKVQTISSRNYHPEPEVDTAIVKLYPNKQRHQISDEEEFFKFAKALFTHKRKKVRNALVDARNILNQDKDKLKQIRDNLPHSEERTVNLDIKKIQELRQAYLEEIEER